MKVFINQESHTVPSGATLLDALRINKLEEQRGIAVAVNQRIISRTGWDDCKLQESDTVTIIQATQGG